MENLELWNKYKSVPSNALKQFDNGTFKGTDINTMWRLKSLTDEFGICGFGWYYDIVRIWNEIVETTGTIFTFAEIKLYIKVKGEWSQGICGVGGNKMATPIKDGRIKTSDEAVKMAVTDAIGVACRNLGFGADVYWENDKTKYTENQDNKPTNTPIEPPTMAQIKELKELGGTLEQVATYFKTTKDKVTKQQVQQLIDKKKRIVAKQKAAAEEAEKQKQLQKEAEKIFGASSDEPDYNDPEWQ